MQTKLWTPLTSKRPKPALVQTLRWHFPRPNQERRRNFCLLNFLHGKLSRHFEIVLLSHLPKLLRAGEPVQTNFHLAFCNCKFAARLSLSVYKTSRILLCSIYGGTTQEVQPSKTPDFFKYYIRHSIYTHVQGEALRFGLESAYQQDARSTSIAPASELPSMQAKRNNKHSIFYYTCAEFIYILLP